MCDRPNGVKWTPQQVLKQLIAQLLNFRPSLTVSAPEIFNTRRFRKASDFDAAVKLLHAIIPLLDSVVIVIDSLDKCIPDPAAQQANIAIALSMLAKMHPRNLRVIITTGQIVSPSVFPGLPISIAVVNTKRRPRLLEYKRASTRRDKDNKNDVDHEDRDGENWERLQQKIEYAAAYIKAAKGKANRESKQQQEISDS
jgi:hypothetical protein